MIAETAFVVQCVFVGPTVTVFVGEITVYTACGVFGVSLIGIRVGERTAHILSPRIVERGFESQVLDNIPSQIRIQVQLACTGLVVRVLYGFHGVVRIVSALIHHVVNQVVFLIVSNRTVSEYLIEVILRCTAARL